jgi:hypothetical protein
MLTGFIALWIRHANTLLDLLVLVSQTSLYHSLMVFVRQQVWTSSILFRSFGWLEKNDTCNAPDSRMNETHNLRKNLRKCQNWICEGYGLKKPSQKIATFADVACEDCEDCEASHSIGTDLTGVKLCTGDWTDSTGQSCKILRLTRHSFWEYCTTGEEVRGRNHVIGRKVEFWTPWTLDYPWEILS